jgi:hypothetical protein
LEQAEELSVAVVESVSPEGQREGWEMTQIDKLDWGYSVTPLVDAAHRELAGASYPADPIKAKLEMLAAQRAANRGGGVEEIMSNRRLLDEARALIAASIENALPDIAKASLTSSILDIALASEQLRATSAVDDQFVHQLKIANVCEALASAVVFLLAKQLVATPDEVEKPAQ